MKRRLKNSVGIWAFGPTATRFMPGGYHPETIKESMQERTKRVADGLGEIVDGFEYHYPNEIDEDNIGGIKKILENRKKDIYILALGLFSNPRYALGSFINPKKELREESIRIAKRGIELASKTGAKFIIWPGGEGYNYPFQVNYAEVWSYFIDALADVVDFANHKNVVILLEHKNSEPAMRILMRNIGMTMYVINKIKEKGVDVTNVKINMDWQHLIMNGEPLAEYAALLAKENLLGHLHGNSGWGTFDDDNMVGASFFMQTLGLAKELQLANYGANGERTGFDLFPYTENPVEAVKQSVIQWEFINKLAEKINTESLKEAQKERDAVKAYQAVYEALGLDKSFVKKLIREHQQER